MQYSKNKKAFNEVEWFSLLFLPSDGDWQTTEWEWGERGWEQGSHDLQCWLITRS